MDRKNDLSMQNTMNMHQQFSYWNYTLNWPFLDVKTMNIHQKTMILIKKTMEAYSKAVILSL